MRSHLARLLAPLLTLPTYAPPALTQHAHRPGKYRPKGRPYVGPTHPPTRRCRACGWWGKRP